MNCPSRTDDTLLHNGWNQNPPRFAPDLTTCEDLNGIVNARENRGESKSHDGPYGGLNWRSVPPKKESDTGKHLGSAGRGVSLTSSGMNSMYM